jgi:hypothetical protein
MSTYDSEELLWFIKGGMQAQVMVAMCGNVITSDAKSAKEAGSDLDVRTWICLKRF